MREPEVIHGDGLEGAQLDAALGPRIGPSPWPLGDVVCPAEWSARYKEEAWHSDHLSDPNSDGKVEPKNMI
jgi:hypothetical protein